VNWFGYARINCRSAQNAGRCWLLICFVLAAVLARGQDVPKATLRYKPVNLADAVAHLQRIHHDSTRQKIMAMTEQEFLAGAHFGLGMWMRNNWGLWRGGKLATWFDSVGIKNADDMSGIILTCYYRQLHQQEWRLTEQVSFYQTYWKEAQEHLRKLKTDTAYQRLVKDGQRRQLAWMDSVRQVRNRQLQVDWPPGTLIRGYVDYQCGLLSIGERTKIEGTIEKWVDDKPLVKITKYYAPRKKRGVMKCYQGKDDTAIIYNFIIFKKVE
jgi:hypothetical protein